jgi:hypothetical protein
MRRRTAGVLTVLAVAAIAATPRIADAQLAQNAWPMRGHGLDHASVAEFPGPLGPTGPLDGSPALRWLATIYGKVNAPPIIGPDGSVYLFVSDTVNGADACSVIALRPTVEAPYFNKQVLRSPGGACSLELCGALDSYFAQGRLFIPLASRGGYYSGVVRINAANGGQEVVFSGLGSVSGGDIALRMESSVRCVYFGTVGNADQDPNNGYLYKHLANSGAWVWQYDIPDYDVGNPNGSNPCGTPVIGTGPSYDLVFFKSGHHVTRCMQGAGNWRGAGPTPAGPRTPCCPPTVRGYTL